ncbi:MAG: hypothetical protein KGL10_03840 [Alphaproteobacteria bacterium]|nr:hypothetical protein [Alphaproteobacteria bacterium]MDE2336420.1 hypothetical protein [Alphaproteobacteria bacterium]
MKKQRKLVQAVLVAATVAGLTGMFSGTARADDDGWHRHDGYVHGDYDHDARWRHERPVEYRHYYYDRYGRLEVFYSPVPRVIVERPAPPPGLNIVIPVNIR